MRPSEFYWECIRRAWRGKFTWAFAMVSALFLFAGAWLPTGGSFLGIPAKWLPAAAFIILFLVLFLRGFLLAPYRIVEEEKAEKLTLKKQLFDREKRQAAMARLWELRAEGVKHRNEGLKPEELKEWLEDFWKWRDRVLTEARKISANLEAWLKTLDQVRPGPGRGGFVDEEHKRIYGIQSEILLRMEEFLKAEMLDKDIAGSED